MWICAARPRTCGGTPDARRAEIGPAASSSVPTMMLDGRASLHEGDLDAADPIFAARLRRGDTGGSVPLRGDDPGRARPHRDRRRPLVGRRGPHSRCARHGATRRARRLSAEWSGIRTLRRRITSAGRSGQATRGARYAARTCACGRWLTYVQAHLSALTLHRAGPGVRRAVRHRRAQRGVARAERHPAKAARARDPPPTCRRSSRRQLEAMRNVTVGASSLTTAELRLVPHLATHLTFPEIGTRLHISRHTVKTQAISIYQKLGVSSRSEAIERMRGIGLLSASSRARRSCRRDDAPVPRLGSHGDGRRGPATDRESADGRSRAPAARARGERQPSTRAPVVVARPRSDALVRIAALVAVHAAPPSYVCAVRHALTVGVTVDEVIDTLIAVSATVGLARVVSASPGMANCSASTSTPHWRSCGSHREGGDRLSPKTSDPEQEQDQDETRTHAQSRSSCRDARAHYNRDRRVGGDDDDGRLRRRRRLRTLCDDSQALQSSVQDLN